MSIDGSVVWEGELDKGCGNQVFDYGKTIILKHIDNSEEEQNDRHTKSHQQAAPSGKHMVKTETVTPASKAISSGSSGSSNGRRDLPKLEKRDSKGLPATQMNGQGSPRKSQSARDKQKESSRLSKEELYRSKSEDLKDSKEGFVRSSTRQISRSKDGILDLPVVDSSEDNNSEGEEGSRRGGKIRSVKHSPKVDDKNLSPRSVQSKADRIKSGMRNEAAASLKERDKPKGKEIIHKLCKLFG